MSRLAQASPSQSTAAAATGSASELLRPYVPRLLVDWLRHTPSARHREVEGTLAFVDISGFTTLTERLARKGKVGAEEINDTLDLCFTELLSVAYDYGAGLVKWGGDAVLLLFEGSQHAERACRGGAEMQRALRRLGRLRTSAGLVTLRMSLGIHSGTFHFFLVGDVHRELVLTGPGASQTVLMEQLADAGQIALSAATATSLDTPLLGAAKGDAILLRRHPDVPVDRAEAVGDVSDLDLTACIPPGIREHLLARGAAEHRRLTAAFLEFGGVDELLADEGPEAVADALDECVSAVQRAALEHQVTFFETDIAYNGGKIMLVSGAPTSAGRDEERMLRALRAVVETPLRLPLRIGANSGRVFAGDFGPPYRRTYSVKGDAVNLAARLMARASAGQILAADELLAASPTAFETEQLEPFRVKGKAQPVRASLVGALTGARAPSAAAGSPLVGRDAELAALVDAVGAARGWQGRFVDLVGEPGLGKSRLLDELRARSGDVLFLSADCDEYEASRPYAPVEHLLRSLLGLAGLEPGRAARGLRDQVAEVAPHLLPWWPLVAVTLGLDVRPTPEVASLEDRFRKQRLEEVVVDLLGVVLATPTVLVFEDVHWLDDASCDLLRSLVAGIDDRPWLVVATRRESEHGFVPAPDSAQRIRLEPLSADDAAAFVDAGADSAPLPPHVVAALAERAGGNPLFLRELTAVARSGGALEELPDSVEGLLAAQIDRLGPRDRTILRCAAVVGATFTPDLLAAALEQDADEGVWQRLGEFVLPGSDGTLRFRHALVRDAAYEGLPYRRRRELHDRVGSTIEQLAREPEDEAEVLSLHFFHAQRFGDAWRYARVAGERAQRLYANVEAVLFYERALAAAQRLRTISDAELTATWAALGDVRVRLGELGRAGLAYRAARAYARDDPPQQAELMLREALVPFRLGRYRQAIRWIRRGLRVLEDLPGTTAATRRARLYAWHGAVRLRQGRARETIEWCRRAIEEATAAGAQEALAHAYYILDYAYSELGRLDEAVYSERSLAIYEQLGDLSEQAGVLNNLGMFAYFRGRWDEAVDLYRRAEEAWERAGDRWGASFATVNRGEILSDQGRLDQAEPLFRAALRVARASESGPWLAEIARYYGRLAARAGRFDEADALLGEARRQYEEDGSRNDVVLTDAVIAERFVLAGDGAVGAARALDTLARAESLERTFHVVPMLQRVRGCGLLQLGRLGEAREALDAALAQARANRADFEIALTLDALVALNRALGGSTDALEDERTRFCEQLGVVATPGFPLGLGAAA
jgi:predicted ATPase/class 3 adenylate cyclase